MTNEKIVSNQVYVYDFSEHLLGDRDQAVQIVTMKRQYIRQHFGLRYFTQ